MIVTGSLIELRRFSQEDVTPAYVGWLNDPLVVRYSNQRFLQHSLLTCQAYLAGFKGSPNLFWSIRRKDNGLAVGTMTAYLAEPHGTADMGILLGDRTVWGQGFGLDAWKTLLHWLIDSQHIRKVTAGTLACNLPMLRLMEKSGMRLEATKRAQEIVDGVEQDIHYFARFRNDLHP
jgi:ribosomal-protein-alanine N-acetyltransferase